MKKYLKENYPSNLINKIKHDSFLPNEKDLFNAFDIDLKNIKVIIIGQDPYHTPGVANGYAFSTNQIKLPPSLKNIYKESKSINQDGNLITWHNQGVFLLNAILSVLPGKPLSHKHIGWEKFTNNAIKYLDKNKEEAHVYLLWGNQAHKIEALISNPKALIIKTSHPSPLGAYRSFINSNQFKKVNQYLAENNISPIKW